MSLAETTSEHRSRRRILGAARAVVLLVALVPVITATVDTLHSHRFEQSDLGRRLQLAVCLLLALELVVEYFLAENRRRYVLTHWPFVLLCVPASAILEAQGIGLPSHWIFVLNLLPAARGLFIIADLIMMTRAVTVDSLFYAYLALLLGVLYVSSLMFYVAEFGINPLVHSYRSAVYWAVMSMTTTGSNIAEYTSIGRALGVFVSAMGLVLFPVFTVYIASAFQQAKSGRQS